MKSDECNIDAEIKESDSGDGIKMKIRMRGKGCNYLTQEQIVNKIKNS